MTTPTVPTAATPDPKQKLVLTPDLLVILIQFGIDAVMQILNLFQKGATVDEAIAALQSAHEKSAQAYLDEAQKLNAAGVDTTGE